MIFDNLGLPRDRGATDLQDSSRLAGVMVLFNHKNYIDLRHYVVSVGKYVRHPREYIYTFSRDQTICLFAGLKYAGLAHLVDAKYKTEGDLVSPSVRGHFKRCAGLKSNWFENLWLKLDIIYNAWITPLNEPNQLICMLMLADTDGSNLKLWTRLNKHWVQAVARYWAGWRDEAALAALIIKEIEQRIK